MAAATGILSFGLLLVIIVVTTQNIITSQTTTSWDSTVATIFPIIGVIIVALGIVALVKMLK